MRRLGALALALAAACDPAPPRVCALQAWPDLDGDGFGDGDAEPQLVCELTDAWADVGGDCDDGDAAVSPGAGEACDGEDDDCDGEVDDGLLTTWYVDRDADGYGDRQTAQEACVAPRGWVEDGGDCDDLDGGIHQGCDAP